MINVSEFPRRWALVSVIAGALVLSACGGSDGDPGSAKNAPELRSTEAPGTTEVPETTEATEAPETTSAAPTSAAPPTTVPAPSPLPQVDVLDVATGETVQFASLIPADRPVLLWFWAPH